MMEPIKRRFDKIFNLGNGRPQEEPLTLEDVIDLEEWQRIHDKFSEITEVCLRTFGAEGRKPLIASSKKPRLCTELAKDYSVAARVCGSCLPTFLGGKGIMDRNLSYACETGLHNFVVTLSLHQKVLGYVIVGPMILVGRKPKERYRPIAEEFGIDLDDFWSALSEVKVISFNAAHSYVELIKDVSEYSLKLSYQNLVKTKQVSAADQVTIGKILNALLDVAFQVTGADVGSIMLLDTNKDELGINVARGLSKEVIDKTRVKIGDGISGRAAQTGEPLIIDDHIRDNRIRQYLNRPHLSSAMVVPIKVQNIVWGVMNLGALRSSAIRFKKDNLETMDKLINLASVALQG